MEEVFERDLKDMQWLRQGPSHIYSEGPSTVPRCPRGPHKQAFPFESNRDNQSRCLPLATSPDISKTSPYLTSNLPKTYSVQTLFSGLRLILPEFLILVIKTMH